MTLTHLEIVLKEHRRKVDLATVGSFRGVNLDIGWLVWHQLSQDEAFRVKVWARSTPVVLNDRVAIWSPRLKCFITVIPEVAPPKIVIEDVATAGV